VNTCMCYNMDVKRINMDILEHKIGILAIEYVLKEEVVENVKVCNGSAVVWDRYPELELLDVKYCHGGKVGNVVIFDKDERREEIGMDIKSSDKEKIEKCNILLKYGVRSIYRINGIGYVRLEIPYEKAKRLVDRMEEFIELYDLEV